MSSFVRKKVSKSKRRYKQDGFDLDLSYITDNLIAMGFPSENVEGVYRNPMKEVLRFLELRHKDSYRVYNLCSERSYDTSKFHDRVGLFPFDDHNAPPFELIFKFCQDVENWLKQSKDNVAVIHCKAGKGRTGLMICAYLIYSKQWKTASEALQFYAAMRTHNKKGVTIPSQLRYVHYMGKVFNELGGVPPQAKPIILRYICFVNSNPKNTQLSDIKFSIYVVKTLVHQGHGEKEDAIDLPKSRATIRRTMALFPDKTMFRFDCNNLPLCGDIKVEFYDTKKDSKLFTMWFHTSFMDGEVVKFRKYDLDKANKDKSSKMFPENFELAVILSQLEEVDAVQDSSSSKFALPRKDTEDMNDGEIKEISQKLKSITLSIHRRPVKVETCLNAVALPDQPSTKPDGLKLSVELLTEMLALYEKLQDVPLLEFKNQEPFAHLAGKINLLSKVDVIEMTAPLEILCFWVNCYNLLCLHSCIAFEPTMGAVAASAFDDVQSRFFHPSSHASYDIGGTVYTALELEYCIIRYGLCFPSFMEHASSEQEAVSNLKSKRQAMKFSSAAASHPLISFALCHGSISSPSCRVYDEASLIQTLEEQSRAYLNEHVLIDSEEQRIDLPQLLNPTWFGKDFGTNEMDLLKQVGRYCDKLSNIKLEEYSVTYSPFLWEFKHPSRQHLSQK